MSAALRTLAANGTAQAEAVSFQRQTRFAWVPLGAMFSAPYERPLSQPKVDRILKAWDLRAVGVLYLSERVTPGSEDHAFAILDGRHRQAAAEQHGVASLPALIYQGLTYADEATLYVAFATVNRQTALDRFRARVEAGDPTALAVQLLTREEAGLELPLTYATGAPGMMNAVWSAEQIYHQFGPALLRRTFRTLRKVWGNSERGWTVRFINGVAQFLARYETYEHYDPERLVKQLQLVTPETMIAQSNLMASSLGRKLGTSAMGLALVERYNDGLRSQKLPPWQTRVYARTPEGEVISFARDD